VNIFTSIAMEHHMNTIEHRATPRRLSAVVTALSLVAVATGGASASIVSYTNFDAWATATATPVTSIFFTEIDFAPGGPTVVNDQYAALGVLFQDHFLDESSTLYPSDGRGLAASQNYVGQITVDLTMARTSVAVEHIASMRLDLFDGDLFIGSSILSGISGTGFIGVVSATPFDRVVVQNPNSGAPLLDNIYFGAPIPAPGVLAFVAFVGLVSRRRRRA